jgi:hypothetical protein
MRRRARPRCVSVTDHCVIEDSGIAWPLFNRENIVDWTLRSRNPFQKVITVVNAVCLFEFAALSLSVAVSFSIELEQCSDEPPNLDTRFLQHCSLHT